MSSVARSSQSVWPRGLQSRYIVMGGQWNIHFIGLVGGVPTCQFTVAVVPSFVFMVRVTEGHILKPSTTPTCEHKADGGQWE